MDLDQVSFNNLLPTLKKLFLAKTLDQACALTTDFLKSELPNISFSLVLTYDQESDTVYSEDFLYLKVNDNIPSGRAIRSKTPQVSVDSFADPHLSEWTDFFIKNKIHSILSYPILSSNDGPHMPPLGVLVFYFTTPITGIPKDWPLIDFLLPMLAAIIEKNKFKERTDKALEELQTSKDRLSLALKSQNMGVWDWHIQSNKLIWDDAMFEIFGLDKSLATETFEDWKSCVHPDDAIETQQALNQMFANNTDQFEHQFRVIRDGEVRYVASIAHLIRDIQGNPQRMTGLNWDITEKTMTQQKMTQRQALLVANAKMATLGEMSSAIAHEINNPLMIILNIAERMRMKVSSLPASPLCDEFKNELNRIEATVERIAKIIRGLRAFARNAGHDPKIDCEIHQIIDESLDLCRQKLKQSNIQLRLSLLPMPLHFRGRPSQISQVILNLINNSIDAISGKSNPWIEISTEIMDKQIILRVSDSGQGIAPHVAEKMMEPFFTTKEINKGTGLGLSIAKGLIEEHSGEIFLDNKKINTSFVIQLPLDPDTTVLEQKQAEL